MDWIERWFGMSPDGGDGSLELLLTLIALTIVAIGVLAANARARTWCMRLLAASFEKASGKR
jgi:hypothetical protein